MQAHHRHVLLEYLLPAISEQSKCNSSNSFAITNQCLSSADHEMHFDGRTGRLQAALKGKLILASIVESANVSIQLIV